MSDGRVDVSWSSPSETVDGYYVYREKVEDASSETLISDVESDITVPEDFDELVKITSQSNTSFSDTNVPFDGDWTYAVTTFSVTDGTEFESSAVHDDAPFTTS